MNKQEQIAKATKVNPDDFDWEGGPFWKHIYLIELTRFGFPYLVNADYDAAAIDFLIDYLEENEPGLLFSREEEEGLAEDYLDEYVSGGNNCRYINTEHIRIREV